jgi:hypothetical protein
MEIGVDRDDAISRGLVWFHGLPCVRGHGTKRYVRSKKCVMCTVGDVNWRNRKAAWAALSALNRPDLPAVRQAMLCDTTTGYVITWMRSRERVNENNEC